MPSLPRIDPVSHLVFSQIAFEPKDVRAAIVTCGGLCPGLNTVIRELVWCMWFRYGVRSIQGIEVGALPGWL